MANKVLSTQQALRYNRQISLHDFDIDKQELLFNAHTLIVGLGGLGCAAAQYLVAGGLGKITLVDNDRVETSNLQRQILHSDTTVGQQKVASAKTALERLNSEVELIAAAEKLTQDNVNHLINDADIVLDCSDNLHTRNILNRACYEHSIPLVSGAAIRMEGQVFCVLPSEKSSCYACLSRLFGEQSLSCAEAGVLSPLVGVVGAMQAVEAIKIIANHGNAPINMLQMYDALTSNWSRFQITKFEQCSVCGSSNT